MRKMTLGVYVSVRSRIETAVSSAAAFYAVLWYRSEYGRLAERLNAPVLLNRALSWKPGRCRESKSANPLGRSEATPSEGWLRASNV